MGDEPTSQRRSAVSFAAVASLVHPDDIDAGFVPQVKESVAAVELDGEAVLYVEDRRELHVLNASATAVWACCDGTQSVEELAAELAEVFGAPVADVLAGALDAVRDFAAHDLIEGVVVRAD